jgi:hypothetical protein
MREAKMRKMRELRLGLGSGERSAPALTGRVKTRTLGG